MKTITLNQYAENHCVTYRTAWNRHKAGKIPGSFVDETGHVLIRQSEGFDVMKCAIYTRVSSNENKKNLDAQARRMEEFATARGFVIHKTVKEVGSGVNDNRKKLHSLLEDDSDWGVMIVEHKDRLTRFGFNYIEALMKKQGRSILVVNATEDERNDLIQDFVSVIYSFAARPYSLCRSKCKTEKIIRYLKSEKHAA